MKPVLLVTDTTLTGQAAQIDDWIESWIQAAGFSVVRVDVTASELLAKEYLGAVISVTLANVWDGTKYGPNWASPVLYMSSGFWELAGLVSSGSTQYGLSTAYTILDSSYTSGVTGSGVTAYTDGNVCDGFSTSAKSVDAISFLWSNSTAYTTGLLVLAGSLLTSGYAPAPRVGIGFMDFDYVSTLGGPSDSSSSAISLFEGICSWLFSPIYVRNPGAVAYGATSTLNVVYPSNLQAGDMLILSLGATNYNGVSSPVTPSGWTLLGAPKISATDLTGVWQYWKRATGSESGGYVALNTQSALPTWRGSITAIAGVRKNTSPPNDHYTTDLHTGTTITTLPVGVTANPSGKRYALAFLQANNSTAAFSSESYASLSGVKTVRELIEANGTLLLLATATGGSSSGLTFTQSPSSAVVGILLDLVEEAGSNVMVI